MAYNIALENVWKGALFIFYWINTRNSDDSSGSFYSGKQG